MEYDRVRLKREAKLVLRKGNPKPWLVTLVFLLLSAVPSRILSFFSQLYLNQVSLSMTYYPYYFDFGQLGLTFTGILFFSILIALFSSVMQAGYTHYSMKLWRGLRTEVKDIFYGFPIAGKVIGLILLIGVFSFLWALPAILPFLILILLVALSGSIELFYLLMIPAAIGFYAYLLNRTLRYSLSIYLLLDHPDWRVLECLNKSKELMIGRRWKYCVLGLSFLGWMMLILAVFYAVLFVGFVLILLAFSVDNSYTAFPISLGILFFMIPALVLSTAPFILWLTPYISVSFAGFYDQAAGIAPPARATGPNGAYPPSGGSAGMGSLPPERPSSQQSGGFYSGFPGQGSEPAEPSDDQSHSDPDYI